MSLKALLVFSVEGGINVTAEWINVTAGPWLHTSDNRMQKRDICQGLELAEGTMLDISESDWLENWTAAGEIHPHTL